LQCLDVRSGTRSARHRISSSATLDGFRVHDFRAAGDTGPAIVRGRARMVVELGRLGLDVCHWLDNALWYGDFRYVPGFDCLELALANQRNGGADLDWFGRRGIVGRA